MKVRALIAAFLLLLLAPALSWGGPFTDNFTRADNTDLGADWDVQITSGAGQIVGNRVRVTTLTQNMAESVNALVPGANQFARITLATWTGASNGEGGVILRAASPTTETFYGFKAIKNAASTSEIFKRIGGVFTSLASSATETWVAGDVLELQVNGSTLIGYRNGIQVLSASDTEILTGRIGLAAYEEGALTDVELDSFVGGDIGVPARTLLGIGL